MNAIRIYIVEDERLIAINLKTILEREGFEVVGLADNYSSAISELREKMPDMVLLDIQLKSTENGIDIAEFIDVNLQIPYIFLTSFYDDDTVQQAKTTSPKAYLTKPFKDKDVVLAIEMAMLQLNKDHNSEDKEVEEKEGGLLKDAIFVKSRQSYKKIMIDDIWWIKGEGSYTSVQTKKGSHVFRANLKDFESLCELNFMFRAHRSYIINLRKVDEVQSRSVLLGDTEIPITKEQRDKLLVNFKLIR